MRKKLIAISFFLSFICYGQNDGDYLFESDIVHTIELIIDQSDWWDTLTYNKEYSDTTDITLYIPAAVIIDDVVVDSIGLRFKGHSSYYYNPTIKKSFCIDFNKYKPSQEYDGLKKLNLNCGFEDPTMMREKLYLDILQRHNLTGPRCSYAKLFINGQYWGLYYLIEKVNKGFLEDRFGNKGGNLFRGDNKKYLTLTAGACANLRYNDNIEDYYTCYELKTNTDQNDWSDLVHLTDIVDNTSPSEFGDSLETVLNTNSFLGAWAAGNIMTNYDAYWNWPTNYYIYKNTETNLFEWLTWDASTVIGLSLSNFNFMTNMDIRYIYAGHVDHPLTVKMIDVPNYEEVLIDYMCNIVTKSFNPDTLFPIIDSLANIIRPHMYADTNKYFSNQQFDDNIDSLSTINIHGYSNNYALKPFITARFNSLTLQMASLGCPNLGIDDNIAKPDLFKIYPNPTEDFLIIESDYFSGNYKALELHLFDMLGRDVLQVENICKQKTVIDVRNLRKGIYIYFITDNKSTGQKGKMIIN